MRAWPSPRWGTEILDRFGPAPQVRLYDARSDRLETTHPDDGTARMYVCGITPYDATHMGHANTYVSFDLLNRAWRAAGHNVHYVQNVTDIDDPLLERAAATGQDWRALAERETQLFRDDMTALDVIAPSEYLGAVETIGLVIALIQRLQDRGAVYSVDGDLYFSVTADPRFGEVSQLDREQMLEIFAERGGDPERAGKRDPLDCLLWQLEKPGEPAWDSPFGPGRPGWHIECAAIAHDNLGNDIDIQGGGSDLVFPHHEMSAGEAQVAYPGHSFAKAYAHGGMVGYEGAKMSKSLGNLVLVSALRTSGVDPRAIRLTLLSHHYRADWEWFDDGLSAAQARLKTWQDAVRSGGPDAEATVREVLSRMAEDLDAPGALAAVDAWSDSSQQVVSGAGDLIAAVVESSLGVTL